MGQNALPTSQPCYTAIMRQADSRWADTYRCFHLTRTGCNELVERWLREYGGYTHGSRMVAQTLTEGARDSATMSAAEHFEWMDEKYLIKVYAVYPTDKK